MTCAFILCGALGAEVVAIVQKHGWDVDLYGVSATDHLYPERIAPDVEKRIRELRDRYDRLVVVFGDCGSQGALDEVLTRYDVERIAGPHCYEMYGGAQFDLMMEEEPGSFFLTDFLVRTFRGSIVKGLGLDRYPELKDVYFHNYRRVVYLTQIEQPKLLEKAQEVAAFLELPLEVRHTGYGLLESRLVEMMETPTPANSGAGRHVELSEG